MTLAEFRQHFVADRDFIHFNNSGQAPIADVTRAKALEWLDRFYREGAFCSAEGWAEVETTRVKLANFIGASSDEVAFFETTAAALSQAALAIPFKSGDEILTWDQEYPSNFYPWRLAAEASGARLIQVESISTFRWQTPVQAILDRVSSKTRAVAVSWVQYQTGAVTDLTVLSRELRPKGIWLVADGIQGIGVRPFNFHDSGFDMVCSGSHKWLCSAYGAAFMAIRKERMAEIMPRAFGATTFGNPETPKSHTIQPKANAVRYEPGSRAMIEVIAMGATLDLFQSMGIDSIAVEAARLGGRLRKGLQAIGMETFCPDGPIVNFAPIDPTRIAKFETALRAGKIGYTRRGPGIRFSVHAFNRDAEVDRALEIVEGVR